MAASPANSAVRGLVAAVRTGRLGYPWAELLLAAGLLALAGRRPE
ncbi:hypothetical protein [Kitasatospora sp. NPDC088351]